MRRAALLVAGLSLACHRGPDATARRREVLPVLPPGQEPLFGAMLGGADPLPGGCRLASASVSTRQVTGQYRCASAPGPMVLELHYPATAPPGATPAGRLAVYARTPAAKSVGLFAAVLERVRARESAVRWLRVADPTAARIEAPPAAAIGAPPAPGAGGTPRAPGAVEGPSTLLHPLLPAPPLPLPLALTEAGSVLTAAQRARYRDGLLDLRERQYSYAVVEFLSLARESPCCGVPAMLAAALAGSHPSPALAVRYLAQAEAAPEDALAQLLAGVTAMEAAHRAASGLDDKRALYVRAEGPLARAVGRWPGEPRLWTALGVTRARLGQTRTAAEALARAEALDPLDPELALARAEWLQPTDPAGSRASLDAYFSMVTALESRGALGRGGQLAQARALHAAQADRGTVDFDPSAAATIDPRPRRLAEPPQGLPAFWVCLGALMLGVAWEARRRAALSAADPTARSVDD